MVSVQVGYSNLFFRLTGLNNLHNLRYFRHKKKKWGKLKNIVGLLRLRLRFIKPKMIIHPVIFNKNSILCKNKEDTRKPFIIPL